MELLKKLCEAYAPSGDESGICNIIADEIKGYADEIYTDVMGNLIAHKNGNGKKVMYIASVDEIGITATHIDDNGFIRFGFIGGADKHFMLYRRVVFKNGTAGVVAHEESVKDIKDIEDSNLFVDIGAKSREDAEKCVSVGDTAVLMQNFVKLGDKVNCKALNGRAGAYVLINAIKNIKNNKNDLYFVFSAQNTVGLRGAKTSAFDIEPDYAVAVDTVCTGDTPEGKVSDIALGNGIAVKVKDASFIANKEVREQIVKCAEKNKIKYQIAVAENGRSDVGSVHLSKSGVKSGAVSIPVRYANTPCETADTGDIESAVELVSSLEFE